MYKQTFQLFLDRLKQKSNLTDSQSISGGEKLMIFLSLLSGSTLRKIGERWQHSISTISEIIDEVIESILLLKNDIIKLADPLAPTSAHILNNPKFSPFFDNCLGALDGTHIPAIPPINEKENFRNRKGYISQNVLCVCDFNMIITYALVGWEGSAHDSNVLRDSFMHGFKNFPNKYYGGHCF